MPNLRYAALAATLLALAGCKDINEAANLLEDKEPDAVPLALAAFTVAPYEDAGNRLRNYIAELEAKATAAH